MITSLSEIVNTACEKPTKKETVEYLKSKESVPLKTILNIMYNKNVKVLLPQSRPPWKKNDYIDVQGMLYKEARRLRIFIEGGGYDNIDQVKRENLFIKLLEDVDNDDAELLVNMIMQKPLKGLSRQAVSEAFPDLKLTEEKKDG